MIEIKNLSKSFNGKDYVLEGLIVKSKIMLFMVW